MPHAHRPNWDLWLTLGAGLVWLLVCPSRLDKAPSTPPRGKARDVSARVVDALMFRYAEPGHAALIRVEGYNAIARRLAQGWQILIHECDIRYADLEEVRELDKQRFAVWRNAWGAGL
jgi:hypothetical protein